MLLLDEPLGALDLKLRKRLQLELKRIQGEVGITFVYVTHDQEEALTMSDRIAVMHSGGVEQLGTPEELYERPTTRFVADFIGTTNLLTGAVERRIRRGGRPARRRGDVCSSAAASTSGARGAQRPARVGRARADDGDAGGALADRGTVEQVAYLGSKSSTRSARPADWPSPHSYPRPGAPARRK